jgi:hypothetical protein
VDPVAGYHYINNKVTDEESGENPYPAAEMVRDFAYILLACKSLIQHNARLTERILESELAKDDALVQSFAKDIKIFELESKIRKNE